ncbi:MAG: ubiquinone/menaquinone biosynthesis methyltransferase [Desulfovibrionaceae bacterium]|jgi:demethylmenaquinone methyltransferase/2-methoxy-6-polyprenyl-1,4-benzoquinol methylase|nr:ubiquinone/menaquinone biosynthesis methyltransferase [Desulfovibrionaceae bacterium]
MEVHPDDHARRVSGMFGRIADWYDFLNRFLSLGMDVHWRRVLVRRTHPGPTGRMLDLAAGTLDVSLEILRQRPGTRVLAMDFSRPMLVRGRRKLNGAAREAVRLAQADGRTLPLPDGCVDCVTIAFGIRNIVPRAAALREILRVLAPGGRLCVLEFGTGRRRVWGGVYNFYLRRVLPTLGRLFSGDGAAYRYLAETIVAFPHEEALAQEMREAGFLRTFYEPLLSGIVFVHVGEKPEPSADEPDTGGPNAA